MPRVTSAEVREIVDTSLTDIEPFISGATALVDSSLVGKGLSTDQLKEIERWISAHFVAMRDTSLRVVEEEEGESRRRMGENTRGVLGEGLKLTRYGQQAIVLDTTGTLKGINDSKGVARFRVV